MSNLDRIGIEFTTNEEYQVVVIDYIDAKKVQVMFLDEHKHKMWTTWNNLKSGSLKNPFHKSVYGVGYLGLNGNHFKNGKKTREYQVWQGMIARCYDGKERHKTYENVTVCDRWHNYSLFLEDLPLIKNYEYWKNHPNEKISLNKDFYYTELGIKTDCKEYSLLTTRFITKPENSKESAERSELGKPKKRVKCIETQAIYESIQQASRETGIPHSNIIKVCQGERKTCGGYTFEYVD